MKRALICAAFALLALPAFAQTVANGPYYATPSWDQQLPAPTRFIVLSNWSSAAVLDRETGLVWERSPAATEQNWFAAQSLCNNKAVGGRKGWKLPSLQELASLVDPVASNPALPAGHPFTNVQSSRYWSATTLASGTVNAWDVIFSSGAVSALGKSGTSFVWCVRGGSGVDAQ
jgi:Protein of unknown function (DUF1566)